MFVLPIHTNLELLKYTKLEFYLLIYTTAFYSNGRLLK